MNELVTNNDLMAWDRHWDGAGWGGPWWGIGFLLFVVLVGVAVFFVARRRPVPSVAAPSAASPSPQVSAEQVLAARFARGEIDEDEYQARLTVLRANSSE